jgi:hypothetical protein
MVSLPAFGQEEVDRGKAELLRERLEREEAVDQGKDESSGERLESEEEVDRGKAELLRERLERIEKRMDELGITLSGVIEVEASYEDVDYDDPAEDDTESSDIVLSTVELGVDVEVSKHVKGHVVFLFEEDDTDPIDVDEGIITLDGADVVPLYLNAGRQYVPFGYFESHFISDPLTLELGETRESALVAGFTNDWIELSLGTFNGDVNETDEDDDNIDGYVASAVFTLPEGTVEGFGLHVGVSYISDIAESDNLQDAIDTPDGTIEDYVGGISAFLSASIMERIFLEVEYLGALDDFEAGELNFDGGNEYQPEAWNFELAYLILEDLEIAARYGGGHDLGDFLPEKVFGGVINYGLFENTSVGLEYLYQEFGNDDQVNVVTAQLAIEF